jgi:large subunit ribosomal protein L25
MSSEFTFEASARADQGKGASRRLRRLANQVPAIVYGADKEPQAIAIAANEVAKAIQHENFFTSMINLNIDGAAEQVVIKDMQRHPAKDHVMHMDFLRVDQNTKIHMHVPLHFVNAESCPGIKLQGGKAAYALKDIEVSCLPKDLPEFIEVDMGQLNAGENIHISDLNLGEGVSSVALSLGKDHDLLVAAVNKPKGVKAADLEGGEAEEAGEE